MPQDWPARLLPYARPDLKRALLQLLTSLPPFALGWWLMVQSLSWSYALTLLLALPTAGFYIRIFLIQHDCGHGCFLSDRRANETLGLLLSGITLTPFHYWLRAHAQHHSMHGDLDRRGLGDLPTLTVREYLGLDRVGRLTYRAGRNIPLLLIFGPLFQILLKHRWPWDMPRAWKREWAGVMWTNLGTALWIAWGLQTLGWKRLLLVAAPIFVIAWSSAMWVLYVQHHFENNYWVESGEWSFEEAALKGTTFYDLPALLHFFTANVGYHHIHHLNSRVPNYRLKECFDAFPELQNVNRITFMESLSCAKAKLWHEELGRMVDFSDISRLQKLHDDGSPLAAER